MASFVRCIVNVATGPYVPLQGRLAASLRAAGYRGAFLAWTEAFPPESPRHEDVPYAFKLFAFADALRRGYRTVLWLDAPCLANRAVTPVFERIERDGHLFVAGDDRLGNWAGDACLSAFSFTRNEAMSLDLMNGTFIGLDLFHPRGRAWFERLREACRGGLFNGPYLSEHAPAAIRATKAGKTRGFVSRDRRCWGHRHDEAVGTCLANRMGMELSPPGDLFETGRNGRLCVITYAGRP